MISFIKKWFAGKGHVGMHGPCVRPNALVYLPSIPLNKWFVTHKPHRGFVVYRAVLVCNANAVMGRVMRKQRHRCCVVFRFECLHGVFGARKHASIKITQHPWRCFRAHSADRVASLRSATLPCKQRNRDAVCPSKRPCMPYWLLRELKITTKIFPLTIHCACLPPWTDARAVRPYMPLACKSFFNRTNHKSQSSKFKLQSQQIIKFKIQCSKSISRRPYHGRIDT